jgi:hypothetical protein
MRIILWKGIPFHKIIRVRIFRGLYCRTVQNTMDVQYSRVSSETSFISEQPKIEPKVVSALSKTRRLFRLFRFNIKTGSFWCSETTETNKRPTETAANLLKYKPF